MTQTLGTENVDINYQDYVIILGNSTKNVQVLILTLMRQAGALGNTIFFTCSAWFLVGKIGSARKKAFSILSTVWCISILIMCLYLVLYPACLSTKTIIKQILPTCFANNWYMTCYIIFLFVYPWLNKLIEFTDQKQLLRITIFSSALWIIADYVKGDMFFASNLILWITIYFLISYLKLYCTKIKVDMRVGITLIVLGIIGYIAQVVVTNYVGLYLISAFSDKVLRWNSNCCPFYIMIAIGSIIIALKATYKSRIINYISGLTMFVYLFHENYLFRNYTRPAIWQYLYNSYGYAHVVMIDILYAIILFIIAIITSSIYKETLQKLVIRISDKLYRIITRMYYRLECLILKIK